MLKIKTYILAHKFIATVALFAVSYGGYVEYGRLTSVAGGTRYVVATAEKTTLISSITGSGQVSSSNQVDIKSKASSEILSLPILEGSSVKAGTAIAYLDPTDAQKAVRDTETALETARLSLEKLESPPDDLDLTKSENSLARLITSKQNAEDGLAKAYDDGFNSISNSFLELPGIVSGLHDLMYLMSAQLGGTNVQNVSYYTSTASLFDDHAGAFGDDANTKYQFALAKYSQNFLDYKVLNRTDDPTKIETIIDETYITTLAISEAVKSMNNLIQFYEDQMTQHNQRIPAMADTQLSTLNSYTGKLNSTLTGLLSIKSTIKNNKNTIVEATRSIDESTKSLAKLKAGPDALDLRSSRLTVEQRENALADAKVALADYTVRAPFDGVMAKISLKKGDAVGIGTTIGTILARQQIAQLSLNEIDAAKVAVGQKATLTFDAVDKLSISGKVASIDTIGTVTQGVVTYAVKISFDTVDARVKAGMSVNAAIITEAKSDTLAVPASAIKSQGTNNYVQVFDIPLAATGGNQGIPSTILPRQVPVEIGVSNDTLTEIISGLKEGDQVVTRTIAPSGTTGTTQSAPSILPSGGRAGGGFRVGG